jgi:flagellar protein FliO/FliZ
MNKFIQSTAVFLSALLLVQSSHAQSSLAQSHSVSPTTGVIQILLALSFVIFLMLAIAWLIKRIGPGMIRQQLPMKVIGGMRIGNREKVMVIEVADQWLVLGITAQQINTLATLPKQELNEPNEAKEAETATNNPFANWLKTTMEKRNASAQSK